MLDLQLRHEFTTDHTRTTAVSLKGKDGSGAADQPPESLLEITYPTADIQGALHAISIARSGRPLVLKGDRGRGKSHILAVVHHALASPAVVQKWSRQWGQSIGSTRLTELEIPTGYFPITEAVHNNEYPVLWDLLFERHPQGDYFRGKYEQAGGLYPSKSLLVDMFTAQPTALILDELQKWFEGLNDEPGDTGKKYRTLASGFIQVLSELAVDRPDLVILVVSVLNNNTDAFNQIHRNSPVVIDFHGPSAKADRQRLVLHRLFKNRQQVSESQLHAMVQTYAHERFRLLYSHLTDADSARLHSEVVAAWPFSPELLNLLDDHILMSKSAQESRDLIRILASVYRARGNFVPIITPADFHVNDDAGGVQTLLTSIADSGEQEEIRDIAIRNLEAVVDSGVVVPNAREIVSSIWMRTMSPSRQQGATRQELQLDITRNASVDDNAFKSELSQLVDNSMNIHGSENLEGRLRFQIEENPKTLVKATARNEKLWSGSSSAQVAHPGKDIERLRKTLQHILVPENKSLPSKVIVLGPNWRTEPWAGMDIQDTPEGWIQPVLVVVPEVIPGGSQGVGSVLGPWLAEQVIKKRGYVRFLLVGSESSKGLYDDDELLFHARCAYLCGEAWKDDTKFRNLLKEFDGEVRATLKRRFNRFALLRRWNFNKPDTCVFDVETIPAEGSGPETAVTVEDTIKRDLFDPTEFQKLALMFADKTKTVEDLLKHLSEPPAQPTDDAIPFLGESRIYEELLKIAAAGKLALNVGGTWYRREAQHRTDEEAAAFLNKKAYRGGAEVYGVRLGQPSLVGGDTTSGAQPASPAPTQSPTPAPAPQPSDIFGNPDPTVPPNAPEPPYPSVDPVAGGGPSPTQPSVLERPSKVERVNNPASGTQLVLAFDELGIPKDGQLDSARIEFGQISVPMLKKVLASLHSSLKASIEVSYRESDQ